ncbi:unnamed protein product [Paramecium sonneborni]|uniref:Uncharacterized protein n=1 Tax=Paramecium sonneborni TaxID=65129 RepID=A0A8S1RTW9_9CILI|nr:unnamed protein product [Paramecium sonneborni]
MQTYTACYYGQYLKCNDGFTLEINKCISICGDGLANKQEEECDNPNEQGCEKKEMYVLVKIIRFAKLVECIVKIVRIQINLIQNLMIVCQIIQFQINVQNVIIIVQLLKINQIYVYPAIEMIVNYVNHFLDMIRISKKKFLSLNVKMELLSKKERIVMMEIKKMEMVWICNLEQLNSCHSKTIFSLKYLYQIQGHQFYQIQPIQMRINIKQLSIQQWKLNITQYGYV